MSISIIIKKVTVARPIIKRWEFRSGDKLLAMLQEDKAGHFSQRDMNYNVIEAWSAPLNMRSELVKKLKSLILKRALAKYVQ